MHKFSAPAELNVFLYDAFLIINYSTDALLHLAGHAGNAYAVMKIMSISAPVVRLLRKKRKEKKSLRR